MRRLIYIGITCLFLVSCDNDNQYESNTAKVELNTVNLFLKDTYSLLSDTNKNPILSFSNLADDFSSTGR